MSVERTRRLLLWCAATDVTFERTTLAGAPAIVGKCIHCRSKLALRLDGTPLSNATLEHIVPRVHGGTDALENLAIACARCNAQKGYRHDCQPLKDPKLQAVMARLQAQRAARWRSPPPDWSLPPR